MLNTPIRTTELQPVPGTIMALAMAVSEIIITVETQNVTAVGEKYGATLQIQQLGGICATQPKRRFAKSRTQKVKLPYS